MPRRAASMSPWGRSTTSPSAPAGGAASWCTAAHGARILARCDVGEPWGEGATIRDTISGKRLHVSARAVINAAGVWAGTLVDGVELRPSRGTHVVVDDALFGHLGAEVTIPVP